MATWSFTETNRGKVVDSRPRKLGQGTPLWGNLLRLPLRPATAKLLLSQFCELVSTFVVPSFLRRMTLRGPGNGREKRSHLGGAPWRVGRSSQGACQFYGLCAGFSSAVSRSRKLVLAA